MCSLRIFTSLECLIASYMGSSLQPNGLIELPQVWGYVFYPMGSSLLGKMKGPKGPFLVGVLIFYDSSSGRAFIIGDNYTSGV